MLKMRIYSIGMGLFQISQMLQTKNSRSNALIFEKTELPRSILVLAAQNDCLRHPYQFKSNNINLHFYFKLFCFQRHTGFWGFGVLGFWGNIE